jgi:hypothetical protein
MNSREPLKWVEGTYLGLGKPGLRGWEVGIDRRARVVWFGPKTENRATRARFSQTNHGGPLKWVEGTYLGLGKLGLRSWELGIDRRARVRGFGGGNQKLSRRGSVFANETWGASDLGRGNLNGVGYTGFEVVGGGVRLGDA